MDNMSINEKIKQLRKQKGYTLEELGKRVGVSKSTVKKWEDGDIKNMRQNKLLKLAIALNTTPAYLMGYEDYSATVDYEVNISDKDIDTTVMIEQKQGDDFNRIVRLLSDLYHSSNDEDKQKMINVLSAYSDLFKK